jgi:hypothetical protein
MSNQSNQTHLRNEMDEMTYDADRLGDSALEPIARFCGNCSCGCPEVHLDHGADEARRVVLTDDFGQRVQMSLEQLSFLVADVKAGALDHVLG